MAIEITKRTTGGYTIEIDDFDPVYVSELGYTSNEYGIRIIVAGKAGLANSYGFAPGDWTVQGATGFTTSEQVAGALDGIGAGKVTAQAADSAGILTVPQYRVFAITITRPANTTVYAAGDVIGDVSAELDKFVNVAKAAGYGVVISNIRLQTNDTGLAGRVINLHFYSDTVTPIADNDPFTLSDANATKRRGMIQLTFGTGVLGKVAQAQFENLIVQPVSRDIPVILETVAGFTPSANSTWIRVEIGCIIGN